MKQTCMAIFFIAFVFSNAQKELPNISLKDLSGKEVSLASLSKNKTIVVSLWATWCVPCIQELDAVAVHYAKLQKEAAFELVAISIDDARSTRRVQPLLDQKNWNYLILLDTKNELRTALDINAIPYTLIVKNGQIRYKHASYTKGSEQALFKKFKEIAGKR